MPRFLLSRATAAVALGTSLAVTACTPWPEVAARTDPTFARRGRPVARIDLLPIDLDVWTSPARSGEADPLRLAAEGVIVTTALQELNRRGYDVGSVIGWNGDGLSASGSPGVVLAPEEVRATADALASYGTAVSRTPGLPVPYLPARLGAVTGADATLYVGGWAYAGDHRASDDDDALIALGIIAAVAVVAVVAVAAASDGDSDSDGGRVSRSERHGVESHGSSVARRVVDHRGGGGGGSRSALGAASRGLGAAASTLTRGAVHALSTAGRAAAEVADAMGRTGTHLAIVAGDGGYPCEIAAPCGVSAWHPPPAGGESSLYLELTLIDNQRGFVLWHAHQQFPVDVEQRREVQRAVGTLLASVPRAPGL